MVDNALDLLTRDECLRLLSGERLGRLALSVDALPVIVPVNFALMDGNIVVRTGPGTKLDSVLADSVVAFEVDRVEEASGTGWSVLVQGVARVISEPDELARARSLDLAPLAGPPGDHFVKISTAIVSGGALPPR